MKKKKKKKNKQKKKKKKKKMKKINRTKTKQNKKRNVLFVNATLVTIGLVQLMVLLRLDYNKTVQKRKSHYKFV